MLFVHFHGLAIPLPLRLARKVYQVLHVRSTTWGTRERRRMERQMESDVLAGTSYPPETVKAMLGV